MLMQVSPPVIQEQYVFIHDAVLESLICGDTQIPASGLIGAIDKLKQKDSETGRTGFETQFHVCHTHLLVHCRKDVYATTSGDTCLCVTFPKGCCLVSYFVFFSLLIDHILSRLV